MISFQPSPSVPFISILMRVTIRAPLYRNHCHHSLIYVNVRYDTILRPIVTVLLYFSCCCSLGAYFSSFCLQIYFIYYISLPYNVEFNISNKYIEMEMMRRSTRSRA